MVICLERSADLHMAHTNPRDLPREMSPKFYLEWDVKSQCSQSDVT